MEQTGEKPPRKLEIVKFSYNCEKTSKQRLMRKDKTK